MSPNKSKPSAKPGADDAGTPSVPDENEGERNTGRVTFDDRGNAVWEWSLATGAFGNEVSTEQLRKLDRCLTRGSFLHVSGAACEDAPVPVALVI